MSPESRGQAPSSFDPEAEQEVDFGRYWRLLGARWWLVAAGLVAGAIVGFAVSLNGRQVYKATATIYLGQPYTASGSAPLQGLQTNPSTVNTVAHSEAIDDLIASRCKTRATAFRGGISTKSIAGNIAKNGQTPNVSITVQSGRRKVAGCAANGLAAAVVDKLSPFANQKIKNFSGQITSDQRKIAAIDQALSSGHLSSTDKLIIQIQLAQAEQDRTSTSQLLLQAKQVEKPSLLTAAHASRVTARSRRTSVVVAALIGLILGVIAALAWDGVAAGLAARRR
jgi:capsular polysaccharide biosynthesis protein